MTDPHLLERIRTNPQIFGGKPIIRDLRISVELVLSLLAQGETLENLLADYPGLEAEDIRACLVLQDSPAFKEAVLRPERAKFE